MRRASVLAHFKAKVWGTNGDRRAPWLPTITFRRTVSIGAVAVLETAPLMAPDTSILKARGHAVGGQTFSTCRWRAGRRTPFLPEEARRACSAAAFLRSLPATNASTASCTCKRDRDSAEWTVSYSRQSKCWETRVRRGSSKRPIIRIIQCTVLTQPQLRVKQD